MPYDIIDKTIIDAAKSLRAISTYSVGYDHIDVDYARLKKIRIGYTPDILTKTTAELAFAVMLDLLRRITEGDRLIRRGGWKEVFGADTYVGVEIEGKTVGILGMGRIGKAFAKKAHAFGMNIIYHNRHRLSATQERSLHAKFVSKETLFSTSDVITLHVPYTKETHQMINSRVLKMMKPSAYLINTSRGKIINEEDLIKALKKRQIAGAALDVFYKEPIGRNNPLVKLDNVLLTPHIGSSTKQTRDGMARITIRNLELAMNNRKPKYSIGY